MNNAIMENVVNKVDDVIAKVIAISAVMKIMDLSEMCENRPDIVQKDEFCTTRHEKAGVQINVDSRRKVTDVYYLGALH